MEPRYEHDCENCVFIGQWAGYDLYRCPQGNLPTTVARFGDDGPDYLSGPEVRLPGITFVATKLEAHAH